MKLEILYFKQFYRHFVFEKDEEGFTKKLEHVVAHRIINEHQILTIIVGYGLL